MRGEYCMPPVRAERGRLCRADLRSALISVNASHPEPACATRPLTAIPRSPTTELSPDSLLVRRHRGNFVPVLVERIGELAGLVAQEIPRVLVVV